MYFINGAAPITGDLTGIGVSLTTIDSKLDNVLTNSIERCFGKKAVPVAGVNELDNVLTPFQLDSGNNAYGTGICVAGSGDTPIVAGGTHFKVSRLIITAAERIELYKIRIAWGASEAAAVLAEQYITVMLDTTGLNGLPINITTPLIPAGTKIWANCWCASDTGTLDLFLALSEAG